MKKLFALFPLISALQSFAQTPYTADKYASIGDTFYITSALPALYNFDTTGANITWNYSSLTSNAQQQLVFRDPKNTGFSQFSWPYIYNTGNVNLSSTNNQTITIGNIQETNANDYFFKNDTSLSQKASAYNINYQGLSISIKNAFTAADTLYKFPLNYTDSFASVSNYITTFPGLYYITQTIARTNKADGWGTVITPYKTYAHCIRIRSNVNETDSISIGGVGEPALQTPYIEYKWLDTSSGYPVLYVRKSKNVVTTVQYVDSEKVFNPVALFTYYPLLPAVSDTVTFQNLSLNSTHYLWEFGDGDTSTAFSPEHVFATAGTYAVILIAYSDSLSDTVAENVRVSGVLAVQLVSFSGVNAGSYNILKWKLAETNSGSIYNVQRSTDDVSFATIKSIHAGNTATDYSYKDDDYLLGKNYYRLQIIDRNGVLSTSSIIYITDDKVFKSSLNINPNPVNTNSKITIRISSAIKGNAAIKIINAEGKVVYSKPVTLAAGSNLYILSSGSFTHGLYYVVIKGVINLNATLVVQ